MLIQILLIAAIVVIGVIATRSSARDSHVALQRIVVILFMAGAITLILVPQWLSAIAKLVGIGRGADLLLYGTVLALIGYVLADQRRAARRQRQLTLLARAVALADARAEDASSSPPIETGEGSRPS